MRLADKAGTKLGLLRELREYDLEGDGTAEAFLLRLEHGSHAAWADALVDAITTEGCPRARYSPHADPLSSDVVTRRLLDEGAGYVRAGLSGRTRRC